jgi:hypothetical protein
MVAEVADKPVSVVLPVTANEEFKVAAPPIDTEFVPVTTSAPEKVEADA